MHLPTRAGASRRTRRAVLAAALPAALAAVALPAGAQAASVSGNATSVSVLDRGFFTGGPIENNGVVVRVQGDLLVVSDRAGITTEHQPNGSCFTVSATEAHCPVSPDARVTVNLGHGDDDAEYRARHSGTVDLGPDDDSLAAGTRERSGRSLGRVDYFGNAGRDLISYASADRGISLTPEDGRDNDGRLGDHESVAADFETLLGSHFADAPLFGTRNADVIYGLGGTDQIAGGEGDDQFLSPLLDGADDYHGGPGTDTINYDGRTQSVLVDLDSVADDGVLGENDNVRANVEDVVGGSAGDSIKSLGAHSVLRGGRGDDHLVGGFGRDTIDGGPDVDRLEGGTESDVILAADGEQDTVICGDGVDDVTADLNAPSDLMTGCETVQVGRLRLAPKALTAEAGETARLRLSWRHPRAWRQLRAIELRLTRDRVTVGEITIRPRTGRISADGAVKLVSEHTRLSRKRKTVTARLAVRLDDSLGGQTLKADVEATDRRGARQLERDAGTVRVAE